MRAMGQLVATALPLIISAAALFWGRAQGFWPALLLAIPAALFIVRLFIIQHDCAGLSVGSRFCDRSVIGPPLAELR
jgi:omega-6 fatty acid desaturase (delta-12 desaturase)